MVCTALPLKVTVLVPGVKVPLLVQLPPRVIAPGPPASVPPLLIVIPALVVRTAPATRVSVPPLLRVITPRPGVVVESVGWRAALPMVTVSAAAGAPAPVQPLQLAARVQAVLLAPVQVQAAAGECGMWKAE